MPMFFEPIREVKMDSLEEINSWINKSQSSLHRVPVGGFIRNHAIFHDDEYFGDGDVMYRFNDHSIRTFCQRLGFRFDQLSMIEAPLLSSQVLNDLIQQRQIQERLKDEEFVVDTSNNVIIGMVSEAYVGYSNTQFVSDIKSYLDQNTKGEFTFDHAYGINTELTIRFLSEKIHGTIKGRSGEGIDRSSLGFEFRNSMVRTSAVRINYYLLRLVCTNGMMVPAGSSINRIFHSGNRDSFNNRLKKCFEEVMRKINEVQSMLETLGEITFDPIRLAANNTTNHSIFSIIPALKQDICDKEDLYLRYPPNCTEDAKRQMKLEHDAQIILLIPKYYEGEHSGKIFKSQMRNSVSMFDFLNVFTEHAKDCSSHSQKLDIEEKTGVLARYIADNAKKFDH